MAHRDALPVSEDVSYQKIWLELQALAWNDPGISARLARVNAEWREVLSEAFEQPRRELGIALEALVSLVMTFKPRNHHRAAGRH